MFVILSPFLWLIFGPGLVINVPVYLGLPPLRTLPANFLGLGGIPLAFLYAHYQYRVLKRHVIAHHGHLCPRCRYDLNATLTADRCPECGTDNDPAAIRRIWREHLNLNRADLPDPPPPPPET